MHRHDPPVYAIGITAFLRWLWTGRLSMAGKKQRNRYTKEAVRDQVAETVGGTDLEYELDNGDVFTMPHPIFYDKATKQALRDLDDDDVEGIARILLGDQYDAFIKAGGEDDDVSLLMLSVQRDTSARLNGRPTR